MFGTGMSQSPAPRKIELPVINSPQASLSARPKQSKIEQEYKIMEKVLQNQKLKELMENNEGSNSIEPNISKSRENSPTLNKSPSGVQQT